MEIPETILGHGLVVGNRMRGLAKTLMETGKLDEQRLGEMASVDDYPSSWLLIDHSNRTDPGVHFHCYALYVQTRRLNPSAPEMRVWLPWFLERPWRFLCVAGPSIANFLCVPGLEDLADDYLRASLRFGPDLEELGERFLFILSPSTYSTCKSAARVLLFERGMSFEHGRPGALFDALESYLSQR